MKHQKIPLRRKMSNIYMQSCRNRSNTEINIYSISSKVHFAILFSFLPVEFFFFKWEKQKFVNVRFLQR